MHSGAALLQGSLPLRCSEHVGAWTPRWELPSVGGFAALATDSGEGGGLVDVSAASTALAVMHAVSGGAGGWRAWKTVRLSSKTPCSSFPIKEGRIEARTPQWKRLRCSEERDDSSVKKEAAPGSTS